MKIKVLRVAFCTKYFYFNDSVIRLQSGTSIVPGVFWGSVRFSSSWSSFYNRRWLTMGMRVAAIAATYSSNTVVQLVS